MSFISSAATRFVPAAALLASFGLSAAPAVARAQSAAEPGAELTVYLATMGQGDQVWEKFGHNAIWIRDALTRSTIAYNYGIFEFQQEAFYPRLMRGDMLYRMGVGDADYEFNAYSSRNRTVTLQQLNLTPAQRHALREFLEWNWLPENRFYRYDYFRDNCSTRVRDALDRVLGGAIRSALAGVPTGTTFRWHSLRLTASEPPVYAGIMLGLGLPTDEEIDAWEEGFIPMELMRHLRSVSVPGEDGSMSPLVLDEQVVFAADRAEPPAVPPYPVIGSLIAGLLAALGIVLLSRRARVSRFARASLALAIFFWGLVTGFFGVIIALLWLFTDHVATYPNMNVLHVSTLALLLAAAAPMAVVGSNRSRIAQAALPVAILIALMSLLGVVLAAIPALRQVNGPLVAFVLPVHIAVAWALYFIAVREASPVSDDAARTATRAAV